ncbi:hypothetical protein DFR67_114151 [Williamsia limnetica]|uniref:Uncharacterized protein n=1 Tax=Williamsia limnetica TaxID=882452 RepID=A0A318RHH0_WILLI|nr:hypothetical protein [Williamsia limnetica]PYE14052.1 hypothetical protein DFR67_114151 [Williamsia limnetica]
MSYYEELVQKKRIKLDIMVRQRRGLPTPSIFGKKKTQTKVVATAGK